MDHETEKIKELQEMYDVESKEWKENLRPRKMVTVVIDLSL